MRSSLGVQLGAHASKAAVPPWISYGKSPEDHYLASLAKIDCSLPIEHQPLLEPDLEYAAEQMTQRRRELKAIREEMLGCLEELKTRLAVAEGWLREGQHEDVE